MARRSPLNRRYQKDVKVGSTRKSAAAAKPKRSNAGGSSSTPTKKSTSPSNRYQPVQLPPDIKRLQKISFALLGVAVTISLLYLWKGKEWGTDGGLMLGLAYACMFSALYIDFAKVRPVLRAIRKGETPQAKPKATASSPEKNGHAQTGLAAGWWARLRGTKPEPPDDETPGDEGN